MRIYELVKVLFYSPRICGVLNNTSRHTHHVKQQSTWLSSYHHSQPSLITHHLFKTLPAQNTLANPLNRPLLNLYSTPLQHLFKPTQATPLIDFPPNDLPEHTSDLLYTLPSAPVCRTMECSSVLKKRRKKMNKHKYKKWLKKTLFLRRRLKK